MRRILVLQTLPRPRVFSPNNALLTLARHLDRDRFGVVVAVPREGRLTEALREASVDVFILPGLRTYRRHDAIWRFPMVSMRTATLARKVGAELILANHAELGPFARAAARIVGIPWICFLRQADRSHRYYEKYRVALADAVAGVSDAALAGYRTFLETSGRAINPSLAIPTGINLPSPDPAARDGARRARGWTSGEKVIGTVGLRPVKRPDLLLEIFARVSARVPEARCLFVGGADPPERQRLEAMAATLGLADQVRFAGQQEEMAPHYAAMDLYAHTSRSEGFPKAVLEAMAHGLPVVAFRVGGVPEAVTDEVTGFLAEPDDRNGMVECLSDLLSNPSRAREMGEAGRRRVEEQFSPAAMAARMMDLFDRVLTANGGGTRPPGQGPRAGGHSPPATG